jgi:Ca2+-binding EF-hand superfamily protein
MVKDILQDYDMEFGTGEISRKQFIKVLTDLDVCSDNYPELRYFLDEYDPEESEMISLKKIEEDYEEFSG